MATGDEVLDRKKDFISIRKRTKSAKIEQKLELQSFPKEAIRPVSW